LKPPPSDGPDPRSITRQLIDLSLPVIGLNTLTVLALAVDTAMCGRLENAAFSLTALGFSGQVIFLLLVAMMGLTVGTVAMVARAHGAGDEARVDHVLRQSFMLTIITGFVVGAVGNLFGFQVLRALGASEAVATLGLEYLRPLLWATPFSYLTMLFAAVLRGVGNTRLPFVVSLFANALNVFLNYGFILGNMGFPALGLAGAAYGTVASQVFSTVVMIVLIRRGTIPGLHLPLKPTAIDVTLGRQLFKIGAPAAADMVVLNAAFLSIVGMLGRLEEVAVAAHGIGLRIQALAFVPGMSVSQATAAMVGQALGGHDVERARRITRVSVVLTTLVMLSIAAPILIEGRAILGLFDVPVGTRLEALSLTWMQLLGVGFPIVGTYVALVGMLSGAGATSTSLRINIVATVLFQIPLSYVLGFPLGMEEFGVWAAFPASFVLKVAMGVWAYRKGDWAVTGKTV
jgi:putative MATE family efflux protein